MEKVAVIICNFNKREYVLRCISSVFASNFDDFDVVVIDNASTDGSVEAIRERFGDRVTLLVNDENTGGAGGFYRGQKYAADAGYQYVLCLDNDVEVDKNAIGEAYRFMEAKPEAGVCGSLIYKFDDPTLTQEMGAMIDYKNLGYQALYAKLRDPNLPAEVECDYAAFCFAMLRTEALRKAGLMPTEYFVYWDDMELCWRIRRFGYKVYAISDAFVFHHANPIAPTTTFAPYYYFRNKLNCFVRHLDDPEFSELPELIVERLYRIMAVNRNNQPFIATHMHALNDALNGVGGKAGEGRIVPFESGAAKFFKEIAAKRRIAIMIDRDFKLADDLIAGIRSVSTAGISLISDGREPGRYDGVEIVDTTADCVNCDLMIQTCAHILDLPDYNRSVVYLDNYWNSILTRDDFDSIEQARQGYDFFHKTHYQFVRDKLTELRKKIRVSPTNQGGEGHV
jgi:hypothetical protein